MTSARDRAEKMAQAVCRRLASSSPFVQDREHIQQLQPELVAVIEVLLDGNPELPDLPTAPSLKEPFALLNLLARRLAEVGVTPGVALLLTDSLIAELRAARLLVADRLHTALVGVVAESFLRAREERVREETLAAFARAIPIVLLAPRCAAMSIGGPLSADVVRTAIESLGRFLLRHDVRGALVDVERIVEPTPALAGELFAARDVATTVGAKVVFVGASPALIDAGRASRVELDTIEMAPTYGEGLKSALLAAGLVLRPRSRLRALVGAE